MITRSAHGRSLTGGYQRSPGGQAAGLVDVAKKGRGGDTELAHVNPQEAAVLKAMGGSGTVNPRTGLREYVGGGPGSQSDSDAGSTHLDAYSFGGDVFGDGRGPPSNDIFGDAAAFSAALQSYQAGNNPEMGPGAQVHRNFISGAQPTPMQQAVAFGVGTAMPFGIDAKAVPNYVTGQPNIAVSWNPVGTLASAPGMLGSIVGYNPMGDKTSPGLADIEIASVPFGDPTPNNPRADGPGSQDPSDWRDIVNALIRNVLGRSA